MIGAGTKESSGAVFFGELLMRLATKRYERFVQAHEFEVGYTGAEANAAVSLAHFGVDAYFVSVVPDTEIGDACINFVCRFEVNTDFVLRGGKRSGTFYLETSASQRPSKVIMTGPAARLPNWVPEGWIGTRSSRASNGFTGQALPRR